MIGIYKIENKLNGKIYIGQSNDIKRRFYEHCRRNVIPIDKEIQKYGINNFLFEIIEECSVKELNERESYWIKYYNSNKNGYNCNLGGNQQSIGENNSNSILTEQEVRYIRSCYDKHMKRRDVYKSLENKISFNTFASIWYGRTWKHIMPEVYTKENISYYSKEATNGELSNKAIFTNEEVIQIRKRYVNETAREIYVDYKERCAYQTLQQILWGKSYKDLPIYKKKEKKWINE